MRKRVVELEVNEIFWFSGAWRKVLKKDKTYLYYGLQITNRRGTPATYRISRCETLMVNSLMFVQLKDAEIIGSTDNEKPERPAAIYSNKKHIVYE